MSAEKNAEQDDDDDDDEHDHGFDRIELARIGFVAIAVVVSWFHLWRPFATFDAVAWGATIVGGYPIFKEAFSALLARADVVLLGNDLLKLVETMKIARRCRAIIMQNFVGTLVVDGVGVLLAAANILNPLLAAFIHVTSELAFILNSTRLLPGRSSTRIP